MKTVLIHSAPGRWPMLEYELDIAQRLLDQGCKVIFSTCRGNQMYCAANNPVPGREINRVRCGSCMSRVSNGIKWLSSQRGNLQVEEYSLLTAEERERIQRLREGFLDDEFSVQRMKSELQPDEQVCWYAAVSGLATDTRDANPDLEEHRQRLALLISQALESLLSMRNQVEKFSPDVVYVYNGRMPRYWPALEALEEARVPWKVYEYPLHGFSDYLVLENIRPHDLETFFSALVTTFQKLSVGQQEKYLQLAREWFLRSRENQRFGAQGFFLSKKMEHIKQGEVDRREVSNRPQIAFFPSSQYEFAGADRRLGARPVNQASVIRACAKFFDSFDFVVRLHPAQPDSDSDFLVSIQELDSLPNCRVIPSQSDVDGIALGRQSQLSITFGSTIGVELAWQKQRVVEFGISLYSQFGAADNANTLSELFATISGSEYKRDIQRANSASLRGNAERAIAAQLAIGEPPKYVKKSSYYEASMVRAGKSTAIRPNFWYRVIEKAQKVLAGSR